MTGPARRSYPPHNRRRNRHTDRYLNRRLTVKHRTLRLAPEAEADREVAAGPPGKDILKGL